MQTAAWFNDAEYSDLIIKLSDNRELRVYKLILCKQNEYFATLCGSSSSFAEATQRIIKLEDDDPDALEIVLHHVYGGECPDVESKTWRFWLDLAVTADKYLVPSLSKTAVAALRTVAFKTESPDTILDVIESIESDMTHDEALLKLAKDLRKHKIWELQKSGRYRDRLFEDRDSMDAHFDALEQLIGPKGLKETHVSVCDQHADHVWKTTFHGNMGCYLCKDGRGKGDRRLFVSKG